MWRWMHFAKKIMPSSSSKSFLSLNKRSGAEAEKSLNVFFIKIWFHEMYCSHRSGEQEKLQYHCFCSFKVFLQSCYCFDSIRSIFIYLQWKSSSIFSFITKGFIVFPPLIRYSKRWNRITAMSIKSGLLDRNGKTRVGKVKVSL